MKTEEKNNELKKTIDKLYKTSTEKKKDIYFAIAKELERSRKNTAKVNLSKIDVLKNIKETSIVVVPGKVLGYGDTKKKVVIYAYSFSKSAKEKLQAKAKSLEHFCKDKINYKDVVIIK